MQEMASGIGEHPVAHGEIAGVGVNRQHQLDRSGLRHGGQAGAVNGGDAHGRQARIRIAKLILEERRPSETQQ